MSSFPHSPRLLKGGLVVLDAGSGTVSRIISLQYNPDTLTRQLQVQGAGENGERSEALRLKGPPVETLRLEVEIDATDQLEFPRDHPQTLEHGIQPQLSALETLVFPASSTLQQNNGLAAAGLIEILPAQAPLTVFVWSKSRVMPVRLAEFSITEEAFDAALNPIRAKISLSLRVLNVNDVGFTHRAGSLYMSYQQQKEQLARLHQSGQLNTLGLNSLP
ncbi:MAG: hypothetical protein E1N59_2030 [Puniceicoccaceae bacterium 5H]|nr:MAG: hypothetical protein E1N59_2030 [Puniceicoccaceae bacterium 5H]